MSADQTTAPAPLPLRVPGAGRILARCYGYLRPYARRTLGAYGALLGVTLISTFVPQFIRQIVDRGIRGGEVAYLTRAVLMLLGLTLLKGGLLFFEHRWAEGVSQGVAYDLRNALHARLSALSFSYHDRTETGELLSRSIQDVERVRFLTGRATLRMVEGLTLLIATTVALLLMDVRLALLALLSVPPLLYIALNFGRRFRPLSWAIQRQLAVLTTVLEQNLRGARIVKGFAQEEAEMERFRKENERWFRLSAQAARLRANLVPLLDLLASLGTVAVLWYGGTLVIQGRVTLGVLIAFTTYLGQLVQPVRRLGVIAPVMVQAAASGERIFEILDAPMEVHDAPDAVPLPPIEGRVRFEKVSFAYFGRHRVLKDVSFTVEPGQVVALLGPTGSGKSTIINLLPRFYDPTSGRITVDGYDLRAVTLASLREQIGIVLQETTLFAATVGENVAFGKPGATQEEIVAAARAAQAHDFIAAMPQGYATPVGERGATLSGGQKQRIAIARALLKDPRILILDDATASVDAETERLIQQALARLMEGRTSFVIAQRLSTVRTADLILVLEQGRIVARGSHAELLRTSGLYAEIYHSQLLPEREG